MMVQTHHGPPQTQRVCHMWSDEPGGVSPAESTDLPAVAAEQRSSIEQMEHLLQNISSVAGEARSSSHALTHSASQPAIAA